MSDKNNHKLLIVEDDEGIQSQIRWCFDDFEVHVAGDRKHAIDLVNKQKPSVVTLDLGLPPDPDGSSEGLAALNEILEIAPHTKIIVVTGNNDQENAMKAIAMGAYDFYRKPFEAEILALIVDRAVRLFNLEEQNRQLTQNSHREPFEGVIACSDEMLQVCHSIEKVAPSDATVLLLGESGTGKELCARALHVMGPHSDGRLVAINCAAIPENLLESELFGYEKGAFTGAVKTTPGKIEMAHNGTLFLDEMGDLPHQLQAKLLRFLQERIIERVGGRREIPINARVVCATHQDLHQKIERNEFREDLYYRISEIPVQIPALRDREGDIVLLARYFLDMYSAEQGKTIKGFTKSALDSIQAYTWPGNVRELQNRIKRAVIMSDSKQLSERDIELDKTPRKNTTYNLRDERERIERKTITRALNNVNGKIAPAADLLGVSRPTLYDLISKLGIKV